MTDLRASTTVSTTVTFNISSQQKVMAQNFPVLPKVLCKMKTFPVRNKKVRLQLQPHLKRPTTMAIRPIVDTHV